VSAESLPYIPTTVLPLSQPWAYGNRSSHGVYILSPTDSSLDLLFLNTSGTLDAASLKPQTVTSGVPFAYESTAFTASVDDNETLTVFTGDCSSSDEQYVWTYGSTSIAAEGQSWKKASVSQEDASSTATQGTPYFLGASLSYSATIEPVMSAPETYVYGGMCPWSNSSASTWLSSASYTNRMVKISTADGQTPYVWESVSSYGPPIAEAGFSFTALTPAISNRSGVVTQEINHVLLGGHTRNAFINMSTAAVWSLPEEAWNTILINGPPEDSYGTSNSDLAVRERAGTAGHVVEPRSGHTAVLNENGTALFVLGGWVGNVTTAATPQLVVIEMEPSLSEWQWSIPTDAQPSGPGIYGHGAVLLPGNVMMVYGGYTTESRHTKRAVTQSPMFLNLTSVTWSNKYTNPISSTSSTGSTTNPGVGTSPASSNKEEDDRSKLGLGLGLGIGFPFVLMLILLAIYLYKRRVRKRRERDEIVRGLSQDASRFLSADHDDEMIGPSHDFDPHWGMPPSWTGSEARDWYTGGSDPYILGSRSLGYETLRGTPGRTPTLPPMALERSASTRSRSAAKGLYLPTTGIGATGAYEFASSAGHNTTTAAGGIHPIYEAEDEDGEHNGNVTRTGNISPTHRHHQPPSSEAGSDPFTTPATTPRGPGPNNGMMYFPPPSRSSATPSPEYVLHRPPHQDAEVTEWVADVDVADALLTARISPHGTTTTTTTTSLAAITPPKQGTQNPSRLVPSRPNSLIFPLTSVDNAGSSSDEARTGSNLSESAHSHFSFTRSSSVRHTGPTTGGVPERMDSSSGSSSKTYSTAKTTHANFVTLQDEGPALLMGGGGSGGVKNAPAPNLRRGKRRRTMIETDDPADVYDASPPGSPSKSKPRRSVGWLGSLRRVFSGPSTPSSSRGDSPSHTDHDKTGGSGNGSDYHARLVGMGPGGRLLRRKQGKEAWTGGAGEEQVDDEDWDVERAVEQRLVQIMFTVPKERLRVVNAEIEREEEATIVDPEKEGESEDEEVFEEERRSRYRREEEGGDLEKEGMRRAEEEERAGYTDDRDAEKEAMMRREEKKPAVYTQQERDPEQQEAMIKLVEPEDSPFLDSEASPHQQPPLSRESTHESDAMLERTLTVPYRASSVDYGRPSVDGGPLTPILTPVSFRMAQTMTIERPKTKVLQMVESIESLGKKGSPSGSPAQ
jgi:hypothetical protein